MQGILKFDLSDPDERREFELACKARNYQIFVSDFKEQVLRKYHKYGLPDELKDGEKLLEHIRARFFELYNEYKLDDNL